MRTQPGQDFNREDDEELERLMEIHSDVKDFVLEERRKFRTRLYVWGLLALFVLLYAWLEAAGRTNTIGKIHQFFVVSKGEQPRSGNLLTGPLKGNAPLIVPKDISIETIPRSIPESNPVSDSEHEKDTKKSDS